VITDIPTPDDFNQSGIAFLNLAWDSASQLAFYFDEAKTEIWDEENDVTDEYWAAAQRPLATAVTLVQQGFEFLLKSRIAAICDSPPLSDSGGGLNYAAITGA
jgi:hypothetical protein